VVDCRGVQDGNLVAWRMVAVRRMVVEMSTVVGEVVIQMSWRETASGCSMNSIGL